ncbi:hypothetical protein SAMN05421690_102723 [Nitrosomonas sp. Nm51]|nr:hypothetical protein SAMN05421690_102723 [Nitrosomonas sp. Nm51]
MDVGAIQLTLVDEHNLFEFTHADFPGENWLLIATMASSIGASTDEKLTKGDH